MLYPADNSGTVVSIVIGYLANRSLLIHHFVPNINFDYRVLTALIKFRTCLINGQRGLIIVDYINPNGNY